ncbi:MAG TPA: Ig domain-containing protein [Myxococcaceae bacterium]|nr:Ig domain-containing protein [Myxococcaceae bacterium]
MSTRGLGVSLVVLGTLSWAAACQFDPDLSRFEPCAEDGTCAAGYTCLEPRRLCLPDCGAQGPCAPELPDAATDGGGVDAGPGDGGPTDAGLHDGGVDAGEPLSLVTLGLPPATETRQYAETLQARGGKPPYLFRATEALPQGFMLDDGVLSGKPTTAGTFRVAVEVRDQSSPAASVSRAYDLRVRPLLRLAGPGTLVNGYLNNAYAEQISATGGTPPYTFTSEAGGQLPPGLRLGTEGGVTGTPNDSGAYTLRVRVTDSDPQPQTVSGELDVSISSPPLLLEWATQDVPEARLGTPYHYVLKVAGASSVTWKLEAGNTPPGIGFDAQKGVLEGAPHQTGSYGFTISATSGLSEINRTFTIMVH